MIALKIMRRGYENGEGQCVTECPYDTRMNALFKCHFTLLELKWKQPEFRVKNGLLFILESSFVDKKKTECSMNIFFF